MRQIRVRVRVRAKVRVSVRLRVRTEVRAGAWLTRLGSNSRHQPNPSLTSSILEPDFVYTRGVTLLMEE